MKWAGLIVILAAIMPVSLWLRRNPNQAPKLWMLVGFLPFALVPLHLFMAAISWREWPGYVAGIEFSVLDSLALALYLSLPSAHRPLPFKTSMALYFFAVLFATLQARIPVAALFYPWQLLRMFLVYAAVTRGVGTDPRVAPAIMKGMGIGLILEAAVAIWQRFSWDVVQVFGTFAAQNQLGLISHFVIFPFFALLLTGPRGWMPMVVILCGILIEVLTVSRATLGIGAFGFAMLTIMSGLRQWTSRKMFFLLLGLGVAALCTPLVLSSFEQRETIDNTLTSDLSRGTFERAAAMILSDHPLGVGSNQYLTIANADGYYEKAEVPGNERISIVHNSYLLVAVETGYVGLMLFIVFLLRPLTTAFLYSWRSRADQSGDLLLGLGVALLTVYIHAYFEWIFLDFQTQYFFVMNVGMIAGLAGQLGFWQRSHSRSTRLGPKEVSIGLNNGKD